MDLGLLRGVSGSSSHRQSPRHCQGGASVRTQRRRKAGSAGGSGRELPLLGRKAKFTRAPLTEGGGETSCKGSVLVQKTGDAGQAYYIYLGIASLGPGPQELEGGRTESPCSSFVVPTSSYSQHFPLNSEEYMKLPPYVLGRFSRNPTKNVAKVLRLRLQNPFFPSSELSQCEPERFCCSCRKCG